MDLIALANADEIIEGAAGEFRLARYQPPLEIFVIHKQRRFFAYLNRCPHTGASLNWQPGRFFDIDHQFIQCATHGALFSVETGYCVRGPCAGRYLQTVPIAVRDGIIYLQSGLYSEFQDDKRY